MTTEFASDRFLPFLMLHEFETLVFASALGRPSLLGRTDVVHALQAEAATVGGDVELLNDDPSTAPSKRVLAAWDGYQKSVDGPAAVAEAGIDHLRAHCPGFNAWVEAMTS